MMQTVDCCLTKNKPTLCVSFTDIKCKCTDELRDKHLARQCFVSISEDRLNICQTILRK